MTVSVHGALLEVYGVGAALLGPSGIGKSECALELLNRGHRLVADDIIELTPEPGDRLMGRAPERIRHYMEIRGIGIFFVPDLFGENSVCDEMAVDMVCRLERWQEGAAYERVGLERPEEEFAGRLALNVISTCSLRSGEPCTQPLQQVMQSFLHLRNPLGQPVLSAFDCVLCPFIRLLDAVLGGFFRPGDSGLGPFVGLLDSVFQIFVGFVQGFLGPIA